MYPMSSLQEGWGAGLGIHGRWWDSDSVGRILLPLFKGILWGITCGVYCWFMNSVPTAGSSVPRPEWSLLNTCIFSVRPPAVSLCLETLDGPLALSWGTTERVRSQKCKIQGTWWKRRLFTACHSFQGCHSCLGHVIFSAFCASAWPWVLTWELGKF